MLLATFGMVVLTFIVMFINLYWRLTAVKSKAVHVGYFKTFSRKSEEVPEHLLAGSRNFSNLFEVPILFYAASAISLGLGIGSVWIVTLAWMYVVLRALHSLIHLTYNHILHRMLVFILSNIVLFAMWVILLLAVQ